MVETPSASEPVRPATQSSSGSGKSPAGGKKDRPDTSWVSHDTIKHGQDDKGTTFEARTPRG